MTALLTYFLPEKAGSHDFKFGFEWQDDQSEFANTAPRAPSTTATAMAWWTRSGDPGDHIFLLKNGKGIELKATQSYAVTVAAVNGQERFVALPIVASPEPNWMNWNQVNNLVLALMFGGIVFYAINLAKRKEIFLRRIPGLDAVDEAIGRRHGIGQADPLHDRGARYEHSTDRKCAREARAMDGSSQRAARSRRVGSGVTTGISYTICGHVTASHGSGSQPVAASHLGMGSHST